MGKLEERLRDAEDRAVASAEEAMMANMTSDRLKVRPLVTSTQAQAQARTHARGDSPARTSSTLGAPFLTRALPRHPSPNRDHPPDQSINQLAQEQMLAAAKEQGLDLTSFVPAPMAHADPTADADGVPEGEEAPANDSQVSVLERQCREIARLNAELSATKLACKEAEAAAAAAYEAGGRMRGDSSDTDADENSSNLESLRSLQALLPSGEASGEGGRGRTASDSTLGSAFGYDDDGQGGEEEIELQAAIHKEKSLEDAAAEMAAEDAAMETLKKQFALQVQRLEGEVQDLREDKESLSSALTKAKKLEKSGKGGAEATKQVKELSDKSKTRVKELEQKIKDLNHKQREYARTLQLKNKAEAESRRLKNEAEAAKRSRVELEKAARKAAAAYAKELKAGKMEADRRQREAQKATSRMTKALDAQAKTLATLRKKQEQVAKSNKKAREIEAKKAASLAARNTAKVSGWGVCTQRRLAIASYRFLLLLAPPARVKSL